MNGQREIAVHEPIAKVRSLFEQTLADVVPQLLQTLEITPEHTSSRERLKADASEQLVSLLGFTGRNLRGCMTLVTSPKTALRLQKPVIQGLQNPPDACDWVGEVVNQLLGRLQNKLHRVGVDIQMATPHTVQGEAIRLVPEDSESPWHLFKLGGGEIQVRVTVEFAPDFSWNPDSSDDDEPVGEGQAIIF
jgi:CheY-specific phosphatase CheX